MSVSTATPGSPRLSVLLNGVARQTQVVAHVVAVSGRERPRAEGPS